MAAWVSGNIVSAMSRALDNSGSAGASTEARVKERFEQLDADCQAALGASVVEVSGATATVALHKDGQVCVRTTLDRFTRVAFT